MKLHAAKSASIQATASLVAFVAAAFVGRKAGFDDLGRVGLLLSLITVGGTLTSLGLAEQVQFALARQGQDSDAVPSGAGLQVQIRPQALVTAVLLLLLGCANFLFSGAGIMSAVAACALLAGFFSVLIEIAARVDFQHGYFGRGQLINSASSVLFWIAEAAAAATGARVSHTVVAILCWGIVAAVAVIQMRQQRVWLSLKRGTPVEGKIQGPAFVSRLLVSGGAALPYMVLDAAGARALAGVLSLVSRLFGPVGIAFSSLALAMQKKTFGASGGMWSKARSTCRLQMFFSLGVAFIFAIGAYLLQLSGVYDLGISGVRWWMAALTALLIHRGLSLAFQFSAQTLLPFFRVTDIALVGGFSLVLYLPFLLLGRMAISFDSDVVGVYLFAVLIIQPLVATVGIWHFSKEPVHGYA